MSMPERHAVAAMRRTVDRLLEAGISPATMIGVLDAERERAEELDAELGRQLAERARHEAQLAAEEAERTAKLATWWPGWCELCAALDFAGRLAARQARVRR